MPYHRTYIYFSGQMPEYPNNSSISCFRLSYSTILKIAICHHFAKSLSPFLVKYIVLAVRTSCYVIP